MAKPTHTSQTDDQPRVALVLFNVAQYRVAIEANQVISMSDQPSHRRTANAQTLLYSAPSAPVSQPTYWLTLRDSARFLQTGFLQKEGWQLGVSGEIALQQLPASSIRPIPKLLHSRSFTPALCGIAFVGQQLVLVLDARKLAPEPSPSALHLLNPLARQP